MLQNTDLTSTSRLSAEIRKSGHQSSRGLGRLLDYITRVLQELNDKPLGLHKRG